MRLAESFRHRGPALVVLRFRGKSKPSGFHQPDISRGIVVGGAVTLTACFPGDLSDPQGVASIQWTSLDATIASVAPVTGATTVVRGISFGVTRVRALVKGSPLEVEIRVCTTDVGPCPP